MEKTNLSEKKIISKASKFKLYVIFFIPFFIILSIISEFHISLLQSIFIYSVLYAVILVLFQIQTSYKNRNKEISIPPILEKLPFSVPLIETDLTQKEDIIEIADEQALPPEGPFEPAIIEVDSTPVLEKKRTLRKPKIIIESQPIYNQLIEPKKYCDAFFLYLLNNGLSVDKSNTYEMFSCLAASHLVIIRNSDEEIAESFVELFSDFIGSNLFMGDYTGTKDTFHDLYMDESLYTNCISSADYQMDKIHLLTYRNIDANQIETRFSSLLDYSRNPLLPFEVNKHFSKKRIQMPSNVWFILITKSDNECLLSERISQSAVTLDLKASGVEPLEEVQQNSIKLSIETITNLLLSGYQKYYFDELTWKGIDQVEDFYRKHAAFSFDNRLIRQLERYSSTYMSFGGELKEALDSVLYAKLLNVILPIKAQIKISSEEDFLLLIEKWFGLEYMVKSKKVLKQIHESFQSNLS